MFGSLGMPEIIFILVLALLIFGPKRLPQVGRTLGRGLREFRNATNELKRTVETEINTDPEPAKPKPAVAEAPKAETVARTDPAAAVVEAEAPPESDDSESDDSGRDGSEPVAAEEAETPDGAAETEAETPTEAPKTADAARTD